MTNKVDVLLINPTRTGMDSYLTPPIHLMYLAQAIKDAGFTYKILNVHERYCNKAKMLFNNESVNDIKLKVEKEAIDEISNINARLIGIGSIPSSYDFTERLVSSVKEKSNVPIILGGSLGLPLKDLWFQNTKADYLCESDGEKLIVELLINLDSPEKIKSIPGLYWRTQKNWEGNKPDLSDNLDYLTTPMPSMIDYALYMDFYRKWINNTLPPELRLDKKERVWPVVFSRGCIYKCTFCFHFNHKHRRHSIPYIINKLKTLKENFGVTFVVTMDDLIMAKRSWFLELCSALEKEKLGIRIFTSGGKANLITKEMAEAMKRANFFRISYGIESGSQTILDEMKKQSTVEDNKNAIKVTCDAGVFSHLNMVLGMPGETKKTLNETKNFLLDVIKENNLTKENISFSYATAYPGTQLYEYAEKQGIIKDMKDYILNVKGVGFPEPILCNLSASDLEDFAWGFHYEAKRLHLIREKMHLERAKNFLWGNKLSRKLRQSVPYSTRQKIKRMIGLNK